MRNSVMAARGRTGRIAGAVLATALLGGAAAGCSGDDDTKDDAAGKKSSAPKATGISPAAAIKEAASKSAGLTSFTYRMEGSLPGEGEVSADAALSVKPLAMRMKTKLASTGANAVEIRLVGKSMYLDAGAEAAKDLGGKRWVALPVGDLDKAAAADPEAAAMAQKNPTQDAALLTASDDLKKVGTQTVDGVETTHYRGRITLDQMNASTESLPAAEAKGRKEAVKQYEAMGVDAMTMDMYIDGEGRTKRFRTTSKADKGKLDLTVTFSDYNKPVTVTKPPAGQVEDLAKIMDDLGDLTKDMTPEEKAEMEEALGGN